MGNLHIVDLTKVLDPETETRRCRLWRFNTGGVIPDFHTIMDLTSHLGTHCECPYHHDETWPSVAELPLSQFMGRCLMVNIDDVPEKSELTAEVLERHLGDKVKPGDTLIIDSPYKIPPFTPLTNGPTDKRLYVGASSAQWIADHGVQSVGFGDGVSIEDCEEHVKPFHDILMAQNCTFLEVLQNLDLLKTKCFFISYAPMPIIGLDSCPVRAYAIEGLAEFSE
ncbi:MAG: cyclase family protein [Eubacteriales bacterium]|nr:cyclase family protein [Eubacteriales bacterium]